MQQHGSWGSKTGFLRPAGEAGAAARARRPQAPFQPRGRPARAPTRGRGEPGGAARAGPPRLHPSTLCSPLGRHLAPRGRLVDTLEASATQDGAPDLPALQSCLSSFPGLPRAPGRDGGGVPTGRSPRSRLPSGGFASARPSAQRPRLRAQRCEARDQGGDAGRRRHHARHNPKEMRFSSPGRGQLRARNRPSLRNKGEGDTPLGLRRASPVSSRGTRPPSRSRGERSLPPGVGEGFATGAAGRPKKRFTFLKTAASKTAITPRRQASCDARHNVLLNCRNPPPNGGSCSRPH